MRAIKIIVLGVVFLLSLAAGAAKLMRAPQEVAFFEALGLDLTLMSVLGGIQVLAALTLLLTRYRKTGAVLAAIGFAVSAIMIFANSQPGFAWVSLIPVGLAGFIAMSKSA